jgi:hypothetical protein
LIYYRVAAAVATNQRCRPPEPLGRHPAPVRPEKLEEFHQHVAADQSEPDKEAEMRVNPSDISARSGRDLLLC